MPRFQTTPRHQRLDTLSRCHPAIKIVSSMFEVGEERKKYYEMLVEESQLGQTAGKSIACSNDARPNPATTTMCNSRDIKAWTSASNMMLCLLRTKEWLYSTSTDYTLLLFLPLLRRLALYQIRLQTDDAKYCQVLEFAAYRDITQVLVVVHIKASQNTRSHL